MDVPHHVTRVSASYLPSWPSGCGRHDCVYCERGVCDDPQTNRGNSDAKCHREPPRQLLARLHEIRQAS